ncbi:MAG: hypothetical protein LBI45_07515, partial [Bacteroidales bacterium]|nr:hypothetical protein [Bacteroidales bacterium]
MPKRTFQCGTNSLLSGEYRFSINWSEVEDITHKLFDNNINALFQLLANRSNIINEKIFEEFSAYGFFAKASSLTILVINEKEINTLCQLSNANIDKLLPAFMAKGNIETLKTLYQLYDVSETVAIFYHEVMWDLMDLLLKNQVIQMPTVFQFPDKAQPMDVAD